MRKSSEVSRRGFVGRAASWAVGGMAAPYFVPSTALAGPHRPGANDRVGIGLIGAGRRGSQLMGLPADARIVAVCDVYHERADRVAGERASKAYYDYRHLLDSKDVDAVIVATPDHWHSLPSLHACQAGKDVYCEKPLTLTVREGRCLVRAARKYGRVFQTGSQQRSLLANRTACELVRSGRIGPVHTVIAFNYPSPWVCALPGQPVPQGLDWDTWCGPTELRPYHGDLFTPRARPGWISFRTYSGGEMTGWGAHGFDQIQAALGMDRSGPTEVFTGGDPFDPPVYADPGTIAAGNAACSRPSVHFRYAGGTVVHLADGPPGGAIFQGEIGRITIGRGTFSIEPRELAQEIARTGAVETEAAEAGGTASHLKDWIDAIRSRTPPVADVEIGHRSATVCHLGNIARAVDRPLRWDPVREVFPDDDAANAWLERRSRSPYAFPDPV